MNFTDPTLEQLRTLEAVTPSLVSYVEVEDLAAPPLIIKLSL